jgi:hypothetical protein
MWALILFDGGLRLLQLFKLLPRKKGEIYLPWGLGISQAYKVLEKRISFDDLRVRRGV